MGQHSAEDHRSFPRSLEPLAEIAVRNSGAAGCAIYQVNPATGEHELKFASGTAIPGARTVDSFPLNVDEEVSGVITFAFHEGELADEKRRLMERIARSMEAIWQLSRLPDAYARKAARIGRLEAELADAKIADRARGMLNQSGPSKDGPEPQTAAADTILKHVESVLRPSHLDTILAQLTLEVEEQLAERALANRAKSVLQSRYGMSEDQAHVHLRMVSRKSRKRLGDVARELLRDQDLRTGQR